MISRHAIYNILLTLPDDQGWADKFLAWITSKGAYMYVVNVRQGSAPLTPALMEAAQAHAAQSLDPIAVSARKELMRRR